jgi:hypothetical protein
MKILKTIVLTFALSAAVMTTAHARDSFSIGINIGGHDYSHVRTHRHVPVYHGYYGAPTIYYSTPHVVYYDAPVRYRSYRHHSYDGYYNRENRYSRKHHSRSHDNGYGYGRRH